MVPADPARSLQEALAAMTWTVEDGVFALVGLGVAPEPADLAALRATPSQLVREADETTFLVPEEAAAALLSRHPGARTERDLAWIRFETPMGWEVVGFLALVTSALARARVPVGAVCGFSRDHLFVARRHLPAAAEALANVLGKGPRNGSDG